MLLFFRPLYYRRSPLREALRLSRRTISEPLVRSWSREEKGLSLMELLVAMALLGIMGALAIPRLNQGVVDLSNATQNLVGSIRMARANAVSRGARYRITLSASSYSVQRLQDDDDDGVWEPDSAWPAENVDLPVGLSLSVDSGDGIIEFNTRGLIEPPPDQEAPEKETISIHDDRDGDTKQVEVYPSGQVLEA